ncbi:BTAD domain-containing putative transcriptional regulator [Streptomyces odonnellii]|uniref:BTAD domain-containing putative transcriptional regulator n=1 Tax=Streptomyces odonnellii TaxID=1417980 RepID=UPI000697EF1C|nr:BTAD domain-containing putative transcriptional regulator [Streptomyces odonnellii]
MEFRILGPLEVQSRDRTLVLGGFKQRAVLGKLLLRANQVVATSELLDALWSQESRPVTARKIIQNAVSGLRAALSRQHSLLEVPGASAPELLTRSPGYMLHVAPDTLDVSRFDRRVAEGRKLLDAGEPALAAELLREALDEWRGPVLSDLVEQGLDWPEVARLRQLRLDAMEYRFEAELACGRHHAVLGELVSLAESEPLRERLCGQLMLALYRCGRQAEALSVFSRVRLELVEEYGLEPSRDLQTLQQHILHHHPSLAAPAGAPAEVAQVAQVTEVPRPAPPGLPPAPSRAALRPAGAPVAVIGPPDPGVLVDDEPAAARVSDGGEPVSRRQEVSVLLIQTGTPPDDPLDAQRLNAALHRAVTVVADCIEEHGGTVVGSVGHLSAALFGLRDDPSSASLDAVRAALAVRDRFGDVPDLAVRSVVTTGGVLVRHVPGAPGGGVSVVGALLDTTQHLLSDVPPGKVYVSRKAAVGTDSHVRYLRVPGKAGTVSDVREASVFCPQGLPAGALGGVPSGVPGGLPGSVAGGLPGGVPGGVPFPREHELDILNSLLAHSRHHRVPYLLTVLGEPGSGKSRLLAEFEDRVTRTPGDVLVLRPSAPASGAASLHTLAGALLDAWREFSSIPPDTSQGELLMRLVRGTVGSGPMADRLLQDLLVPNRPQPSMHPRHVMNSWAELLSMRARQQPLVLCLDNLHLASDAVLDWVEELATTAANAALLIVACARPELLGKRPLWGVGQRSTSTLSLTRLSEPPGLPLQAVSGGEA